MNCCESESAYSCAYPCGLLKQDSLISVEKINLEVFWVGRLVMKRTFVGTERDRVREDRSCEEAREHRWGGDSGVRELER